MFKLINLSMFDSIDSGCVTVCVNVWLMFDSFHFHGGHLDLLPLRRCEATTHTATSTERHRSKGQLYKQTIDIHKP